MNLKTVSLEDKYTQSGDIYISGVQALVRLPLLQRQIDQSQGYNTACFISGYRGSPLGTYDSQLQQERKRLEDNQIIFRPGINEDLAATAIWGAQQVGLRDQSDIDGVFGIWYGKGPGSDRTGDVFRHANLAGTAQKGGVLALLGDDHTGESSTTCHQSELAMVDAMIPILNPAGIQEMIEYGLQGWQLSRYSGCWVALKCVHDTVSSTATINIDIDNVQYQRPELDNVNLFDGGNIRLGDTHRAQEERLHEYKMNAVKRYAYANQLDRIVLNSKQPKVGIFTTGKSYLDVSQALIDLGIDEAQAEQLGIRLYKIALVWPLEPQMALQASEGLQRIIVVEEKRDLIENQLKALLFNQPQRPTVVGKYDEHGNVLLRSHLDLNSNMVAIACAETILSVVDDKQLTAQLNTLKALHNKELVAEPIRRTPYFCAGCPHNSSTQLPEGSRGMAGIGCHWMVQGMERDVDGYCQMGGEGASWMGEAPFAGSKHIFQNLGDGTYYHSGSLAIRATISSGVNITFKILYNDAVAMTGGQTHDGELTPQSISWQVFSEGVKVIKVVTDEPGKYPKTIQWAPGVSIHSRDELNQVQLQLSKVEGTSVLIYDQTCAAVKRRRRKRKQYPDPAKRLFINSDVCEGCGDCGKVSNCIAISPLETVLGRKRAIDQSACNKDYSCVKGFCPSFVTVHGGEIRKTANLLPTVIPPDPITKNLENGYSIAITGVGGTGVVTVGALIGMAAHLDNKGVALLDMTGLAQKGGSVMSHIRLAPSRHDIGTIRIAPNGCDLILGCDSVVAASHESLQLINSSSTRIIVNTEQIMPGAFTRQPNLDFPADDIIQVLSASVADDALDLIEATSYGQYYFGDSIAANLIMLGYAYQQGLIPLSFDALNRAIELNAISVEMNKNALMFGRQLAAGLIDHSPAIPQQQAQQEMSLEALIEHRSVFLTKYQDEKYALRYKNRVAQIQQIENKMNGDSSLTRTVANNYFKLLAYKDEYEVARLYSTEAFHHQLRATFEGDIKLKLNLAPPIFSRRDSITGQLKKREFGAWVLSVFKQLQHFKFLRGSAWDIFGYSAERRQERQLIVDYEQLMDRLTIELNATNIEIVTQLLALPDMVRGFGHVKENNIQQMQQQKANLLQLLSTEFIEAKSIND